MTFLGKILEMVAQRCWSFEETVECNGIDGDEVSVEVIGKVLSEGVVDARERGAG